MKNLVNDLNKIIEEGKIYNDKDIIKKLIDKNKAYNNQKSLKSLIFNNLKKSIFFKIKGNSKSFVVSKTTQETTQETNQSCLSENKIIKKNNDENDIFLILFKIMSFLLIPFFVIMIIGKIYQVIPYEILFYILLFSSITIIVINVLKIESGKITYNVRFNEISLVFMVSIFLSYLYSEYFVKVESLQESNLEKLYFFDIYQLFFFTIILIIIKNIDLFLKTLTGLIIISFFLFFYKNELVYFLEFLKVDYDCYQGIGIDNCSKSTQMYPIMMVNLVNVFFVPFSFISAYVLSKEKFVFFINLINSFFIKLYNQIINFILDFFGNKYQYTDRKMNINKQSLLTFKPILYLFFISIFFTVPDKIEDIYYAKNTEPNMGHCVNIDEDTIISKKFGRILIDKKYLTDTEIKEYVEEYDIEERFFSYECKEENYYKTWYIYEYKE